MDTVREILASHPGGISRAGILAWAQLRIAPDFDDARLDGELEALGDEVVAKDGFLWLRRAVGASGASGATASTNWGEPRSARSSAGIQSVVGRQLDERDRWSFHRGFGLGIVASLVTVAAYVVMLVIGDRDGATPRLETWEGLVVLALAVGVWLACGDIAGWLAGDRAGLGGYALSVVLFGALIVAGGFDLGEAFVGTDIPRAIAALGITALLAVAGLYGYRIGHGERDATDRRETQVEELEDEGWPASAADAAMEEWEHEAESQGLWPETSEYWDEAAAWLEERGSAHEREAGEPPGAA